MSVISSQNVQISNGHVTFSSVHNAWIKGHTGDRELAHAARFYAKSFSFASTAADDKFAAQDGGSELGTTEDAPILITQATFPLYPKQTDAQVSLSGYITYNQGQAISDKLDNMGSTPVMEFEISELNENQIILDNKEMTFTYGVKVDDAIKFRVAKDNIQIIPDDKGNLAEIHITGGNYSEDVSSTIHVQTRQPNNIQSFKVANA
ncbi:MULTISPECIES: hypothetical protein [Cysteiniphilum]|uniref:hypothetical protein n=1 Tax=Cysteiniphilum TaxID=2056696 RepID=UPI001786A16F|nr:MULTISPECIES: hypothetical protein [Cysteiniphilum]